MTVKDYIKEKFKGFGVKISEADLFDICTSVEISEEGEMNKDNKDQVSKGICLFIPSLLLRPSISESGFSITMADRGKIEAYYAIECAKYGIKNQLKPKIRFR